MVREILSCRDRVCALEGVAGAGKTTACERSIGAWKPPEPTCTTLAPPPLQQPKSLKSDGFRSGKRRFRLPDPSAQSRRSKTCYMPF